MMSMVKCPKMPMCEMPPTEAIPVNMHKQMAGDPVHAAAGGGMQWGEHGKVYRGPGARAKATAQGRAAYASGYKGK